MSIETSIPDGEVFDALVVGSGFGGSVVTYRLAQEGFEVCLLERGRPYPPNSFARSPYAMSRNFWAPDDGQTGLFDVWSFEHVDAIVSAGLGGGSLIYANVTLRKDENWFYEIDDDGKSRPWPISRADLDPHYDAVEKMIRPQVFPMGSPGFSDVSKTQAFRAAAGRIGYEETTYDKVDVSKPQWFRPPIAVIFANEGEAPKPAAALVEENRNLHDADRQTCRLVGECDVGCNVGAKNSLDYTYLSRAVDRGAHILTLAEVKSISRDGKGFKVTYKWYAQDHFGETRTVRCKILVLAAGTIGTSYLLLRNRENLPAISDRLGHRFSGNGDLLTFATNAREEDGSPRLIDPSHGPVITAALRTPDSSDGADTHQDGFYLEDSGYPVALDWIVQLSDLRKDVPAITRFAANRLKAKFGQRGQSELGADLRNILTSSRLASGSMPLLGMGRDTAGGRFYLDSHDPHHLRLSWNKKDSQLYLDEAVSVSKRLAQALGAKYEENPLTHLLQKLITVHALGGCSMADTASGGVVDVRGEVFGVPGLFCADGSILPGPVGANPSMTIAAIADRIAEGIIGRRRELLA